MFEKYTICLLRLILGIWDVLQFALDIQLQETRAGSAVCSNNVEALLRETHECHFPRSPIENAAPLIDLNW